MNVYCITSGKIYNSTNQAARHEGLSQSSIAKAARSEKPIHGLRFKYTHKKATVPYVCVACGAEFYPSFVNECSSLCEKCRKGSQRNTCKRYTDRPFTFDSNLCIVSADVRGEKIEKTSEGLDRPIEAIKKQIELLKQTGDYYRIKSILTSEPARKMSFVKIA